MINFFKTHFIFPPSFSSFDSFIICKKNYFKLEIIFSFNLFEIILKTSIIRHIPPSPVIEEPKISRASE